MTARRALSARRQQAGAVLLCLVGGALAAFAATRTWAVVVVDRPAALPDLRQVHTGAAVLAWLPAVAVVAVAGAGALLGTRGLLRRLVGGLLLLAGVAVAVGAVLGAVLVAREAAGRIPVGWPLLCLTGGLLCVLGGAWAVARGDGWPTMGARYERPGTSARAGPAAPVDTRDTWDALDRGEDPTVT